MGYTLEQLSTEGKRLIGMIDRLLERRRVAEERIVQIEAKYPQRLIEAAETGVFDTLDGMAAEIGRLRGILAEPTGEAVRIIKQRMEPVREKSQRIRWIQEARDENLQFRLLFNKALAQREFYADQEETLRCLAGHSNKPAVELLCSQLNELKRLGPALAKFEEIVTIEPFSEEPDLSVIEVD